MSANILRELCFASDRNPPQRLGPELDVLDPSLSDLTKEQYYYWKRRGNNTFNEQDAMGLFILGLLLVCVGSVCFPDAFGFLGNDLQPWVSTSTAGVVGILLVLYPLRFLYIWSALLTLNLRTPEFLDRDIHFPRAKIFGDPDVFRDIQSEVRDYLSSQRGGTDFKATKDTFSGYNAYIGSGGTDKTQWRLKMVKMIDSYGPGMRETMPCLCNALEQCPEVVSCAISVLEPGVKIPMHVGYYKGFMRYMLPINVPRDGANIWLNVNGCRYTWTEGEGVLWDDTYPHAVYNRTTEVRVVLYMDVLRHVGISRGVDIINRGLVRFLKYTGIASREITRTEVLVNI